MRFLKPLLCSVCLLPFVAPGASLAQSLKITAFPLHEQGEAVASPVLLEKVKPAVEVEVADNSVEVRREVQIKPRYSADEFREMALKQLNYEPPKPVVIEVEPPAQDTLEEPVPEAQEPQEVVVEVETRLAPPVIAFVETQAPEPVVVETPREKVDAPVVEAPVVDDPVVEVTVVEAEVSVTEVLVDVSKVDPAPPVQPQLQSQVQPQAAQHKSQPQPQIEIPDVEFPEVEVPEVELEVARAEPLLPEVSAQEDEPLEGNPYEVYQARVSESGIEREVRISAREDAADVEAVAPVLGANVESIEVPEVPVRVPEITRVEDPKKPQIIKLDAPEPKWTARTGNTLRSVLQLWSEQEGVEFVWQSNRNYPILKNYNSTENYSQAVGELLDMYLDDDLRPIGHLQIDPESNRKRLTIVTAANP